MPMLVQSFIRVFVDVFHQSPLCRLEALGCHFGDALHELIAQFVVLFTLFPQSGSVEKHRFSWFQSASAQVQGIRWEKPGPAQIIAWSKRLNGNDVSVCHFGFEYHLPSQNKIETVGRAAFREDGLPRFKLHFQSRIGEQLQVPRI
jgi:hypothetical protein